MKETLKDKIPISGIVLPFLYGFAAIMCFLFSAEIFSTSFLVEPIFDPEFNTLKVGLFNLIYALIIRVVFVNFRDTYLYIIPILALYELGTFVLDVWVFYCVHVPYILYTAVFHFGLFTLLMYERKLFRK